MYSVLSGQEGGVVLGAVVLGDEAAATCVEVVTLEWEIAWALVRPEGGHPGEAGVLEVSSVEPQQISALAARYDRRFVCYNHMTEVLVYPGQM